MLNDVRSAVTTAFADLDDVSQAWLLGIIPRGRLPRQIGSMALSSDSRLVQMNYLMYHISGEDDPMLAAAQRPTAHPHVRHIAESYAEVFERLRESSRQGGTPPAGGEPSPQQ
jgi:hypothetical protein